MTEVVLEQKAEVKAFSAFGKRNANDERIQKDEEELKQLLNAEPSEEKKVESVDSEDDSTLNAEERTFKKRYGDLRRHSQQKESGLQKQIDDLREQLEKSTSNQIQLPKSEDELSAWAAQYPDVAKIVETIAIKKAKEQTSEFEKRFKSLDEREQNTAREKAELELTKLHPDFEKIRDSDEFHEWVEAQPKWIQQALYENDTDFVSASRAIDLYKSDKGLNKTKKTRSDKDAATSVGVRNSSSAPSNDDVDGTFYESQVNKMSIQQYEANQEAIEKAIRTGKFVYDVSGSAR
jgi:hypothetical protein